jgi:hypothetical protein
VAEVKNQMKNPNSLILNQVRTFYVYDMFSGPTIYVEVDYSGENSLGGYNRSYYYYPSFNGTKNCSYSIIDQQKMEYSAVSVDKF